MLRRFPRFLVLFISILIVAVLSACSREQEEASSASVQVADVTGETVPAEIREQEVMPVPVVQEGGLMNTVKESDPEAIPAGLAAQLKEMSGAGAPALAQLYGPMFPDDMFVNMDLARNVHYGPAERNVLDVVTARGMEPGRPVVVFVHGGGFGGGNKSSATTPFYDNIPRWMASVGLLGVNINYRYAPESTWPSGIEDMRAVIVWLKQNIAFYGGDPDLIFLWGKSTGASHVVDYIADVAKKGEPQQVTGVILNSGFYALGDEPAWEAYYGDDVSLYPERNALPGVVASGLPIMASYAEFDGDMYKEQFNILLNAMNAAGRPMDTLYLRSHSHLSENYAIGTGDTSLSGPVLDFVLKVSGEKGKR